MAGGRVQFVIVVRYLGKGSLKFFAIELVVYLTSCAVSSRIASPDYMREGRCPRDETFAHVPMERSGTALEGIA